MADAADFHYKTIPALAAYIDRIGAEQLNFRRFILKEHRGKYYVEKTLITIKVDGSLICTRDEHAPTEEEAANIKAALAGMNWPKAIGATEAQFKALRKKIGNDIVMPFYSRADGRIIMAQQRRQNEDGSKNYIPWTMFSDGKWRAMEPDGALPFFKPKKEHSTRIMIHEGAKAAEAAAKVEKGHPWYEELKEYEHWGIIGGALAPHRANYAELEALKPIEVVYSCDNDAPGLSALQVVSRCWGRTLKGIRYGSDFPLAWDMADELPKSLYSPAGAWKGRKLASYMSPATFATSMMPDPENPKKKNATLNKDFGDEWMHTVKPEFFLNVHWPHIMYTEDEFNSVVRPFSDVKATSDLVRKNAASKSIALRYMPNKEPGTYATEEGVVINTYRGSAVTACEGDAGVWLDFLEGLVPDPEDRRQVSRWIATLVARPDIRMKYSLLMVSEQHGVGKTTLAESILRPLVGPWNCSTPSGKDISQSSFNGWAARKRLVIVGELYAGNDSRVYDQLKTIVTDQFVQINEKFVKEYTEDNWAHIYASSNSLRALKIEDDDRRWLVPKVGGHRPQEYWDKFHSWLEEADGLGIIKRWCEEYLKTERPVGKGEHSPSSSTKKQMIIEGYSHGQIMISEVLERVRMKYGDEPWVVLDTHLVEYVKGNLYGGRHSSHLERPATARKVAERMGLFSGGKNKGCLKWNIVRDRSRIISNSAEIAQLSPKKLADDGMRPVNLTQFSST